MNTYCDRKSGRAMDLLYEWLDLPRQEKLTNFQLLKAEE
jgi:hypothetical protein